MAEGRLQAWGEGCSLPYIVNLAESVKHPLCSSKGKPLKNVQDTGPTFQLLAGLALPAVPPQQWALSAGNGSSEVEVVPFQEVWGRSYCRALERLVDIVSEYPSEVQHMFSPSCISLLRCTGCCGDENLHCVPVETVNVTMQLLKIHSEDRPSYVELTFSQHVRCECRPLREKMKPESHFVLTLLAYCRRRPKGRGKRKREKQRPRDCHLCGNTVPRR
ncbi:placenta growth factor isoform X3 [Felis catus]|uniref:placenta growth factor isoform X3 n=1 Tax=Felis catus TaxID=9685 RepID=UPI001D19B119|nr:placenta growth factor isoform X3 [Felis catus]